jgi:hypothetical protein
MPKTFETWIQITERNQMSRRIKEKKKKKNGKTEKFYGARSAEKATTSMGTVPFSWTGTQFVNLYIGQCFM